MLGKGITFSFQQLVGDTDEANPAAIFQKRFLATFYACFSQITLYPNLSNSEFNKAISF